MTIKVKDADDQNPVFSQDVYRASVSESATITVSIILFFTFLFPIRLSHLPAFLPTAITCSCCSLAVSDRGTQN